ncbi:uncharacterized protein LOC141713638 [Apium graveolens]|uniref:uncharacterized protein LOC141713638 n=1 Tax=Apium graveolens TaxID=4045 RepID=UPI003D7BA7D6
MWHEKQENFRLSDQKTSSNKSFGDYVYCKVIPPSGDHVDSFNGLSGKRKLAANDLTRESNIKEFRSPVGVNEQESKNGVESFAEQATSSQQYANNDNYGRDFPEVWSSNGVDSRRNATDKTNNASLSQKEAPSATTMPVGENVIVLTQQAPACQTEDFKPLQNEVQFCGSMLGKSYENNEQNHVGSQHKAVSPEMKKSKNTSVDDNLSKNGSRHDSLVGDGEKIVQDEGPSKADENSKLSSGNSLITVNNKLWDGRVQLSSSVTVSAVAFFQSGEKLPDTSWSGFIEVKGKVRLEAFEKYIQDLPRSRNRGLMVISLCWKEGSSESEFAGMKEVSNGYKKGEKVGYAQLSPGTDLYICPRSSTIITILAKYGFFKGMSAIEDKQESLIGCVVWRKSQVCLNSVSKTVESKCKSSSEQHATSVSGSLSNQVTGKKSYSTQAGQQTKPTQHVTAVSTPSLECTGGIGNEIKKIESSNVHLEIKKSSSADTIPATTLVPSNISVPQKMSVPSPGPCQASSGTLFKVQEFLHAISGVEQSKVNWQEQNASVPVQYNAKKLCSPIFDEDDLPEYDFGVARGSSTALSKGTSMLDMKLIPGGNFKQDGSVSVTMGTVHYSICS